MILIGANKQVMSKQDSRVSAEILSLGRLGPRDYFN
jgi:hypothetical protein